MAALLTPQFSGAGSAILRAQFGAVVPAGVLGSIILLTTGGGTDGPGFLYNDVLPGDESKRFTFVITRPPTLGTLTAYPDGTFTYSGLPDTFEYEGFADGVSYGVATVEVGTPAVAVSLGAGGGRVVPRSPGAVVVFGLLLGAGGGRLVPRSASAGALLARLLGAGGARVVPRSPGAAGAFGPVGPFVFAAEVERKRWTASNRHRGVSLRPDVVGPLRQGERKVVVFDLAWDLGSGGTVAAASVVVVLRAGVDASPAAVLVGLPVVDGTTVQQVVDGHAARCLYGLQALVTDDRGGRHVVAALLPCA